MNKVAEQDSLEARLREACVDWNGEQISDNSTPRYEISCGTIREAADTLSQMRAVLEDARIGIEAALAAYVFDERTQAFLYATHESLQALATPKIEKE